MNNKTKWLFFFFIGFSTCKVPQFLYEEYLGRQVKEWKKIDKDFRLFLAPHYDLDLTKIRYAENIDIKSSFDAITIKDTIYFKNKMKLSLLAHELVHAEQFKKDPVFMERYYAETFRVTIQNLRKVNKIKDIHSNIAYEKLAKTKAKIVSRQFNLSNLLKLKEENK